jgi:hypothetical protein
LRGDLPVWLEWCLVGSRIALEDIGVWSGPRVPHPAYTERAWPDMGELIRHNGQLRSLIDTTIHDPTCIDPHLFRVEVVDAVFKRHLSRQVESTNLLFALLTFGLWHRHYGPR